MPPTESRSRDEWLAEARRRGERIRRRRRFTAALVGAFALVLPVIAVTAIVGGDGHRGLELTAAGPAPTGQASTAPDSPVAEPGVAPATETTSLPATGGGPAVGGSESPPTSAEVHGRVATINGSPIPPTTSTPALTPTTAPTTSVPPADEPVVRPPAASTATTGGSASTATADATIPPANVPLPACPAADLRVTLSTDKSTYRPGELVEGSSALENRSAGTCLVPTWINVAILDGAGEDVFASSSSYGLFNDPRKPEPGGTLVKAEPGTSFTSTFNWATRHCNAPPPLLSCSGSFPPGAYTAVVRWGDGGPTVRTTFQLSG